MPMKGDGEMKELHLEDRRTQERELRRKANDYLKAKGLPLIKSKDAGRSLGKPRKKRSRQASQYRRKGLWEARRSEKKGSNVHVNVHYNRDGLHIASLRFAGP